MIINIPKNSNCLKNWETNKIPGDKSVSHRLIIMGSISKQTVKLENFLFSEDCLNTMKIFKQLGVNIEANKNTLTVKIKGVGLHGLKSTDEILDVGNSGTSIRLLTGLLAGQKFKSNITGDESIQKRPMMRVIAPLRQMNARIDGTSLNNDKDLYPTLTIQASEDLKGVEYEMPIASAQVKSSLLLAALYAKNELILNQPAPSRDHTERLYRYLGLDIKEDGLKITYKPGKEPVFPTENGECKLSIPADFSSASFFIVLGLITEGADFTLHNIGLNPSRKGLLDILMSMGANIEIVDFDDSLEPTATLRVKYSQMQNFHVPEEIIPNIIDEIPILSVAALFSNGVLKVTNAKELRVKESDRIKGIEEIINGIGGKITAFDDGFELTPTHKYNNFTCESKGDHRIAMSAIIASIAGKCELKVNKCESIYTSFPNFFDLLNELNVNFTSSNF